MRHWSLSVLLAVVGALVLAPAGPAAAADPVIAAAGDIACDPQVPEFNNGNGMGTHCGQRYVSDLLVNAGLAAVLPLGDNQYECGSFDAHLGSYGRSDSWGE